MYNIERLLEASEIVHSDLSPEALRNNLFHVFERLYRFPRINLILFKGDSYPDFLGFRNMDPLYISLYREMFYKKDVFIPSKVRKALKGGFVLTYADVTSLKEFKRGPYYNDFLRPQGIEEMLMISLPMDTDLSFVIGLACSSRETSNLPLLQELDALARQVRIAVKNAERLEILEKTNDLIDGFAKSASLGVILVRNDAQGICLTPHCSDDGAVSATSDHAIRPLSPMPASVRGLVDQLNARLFQNENGSTEDRIVQTVYLKGKPIELEVVPFRRLALSPGMSYLLFIRGNIEISELCKRLLKGRYNISEREMEVISLIFQGHSNARIAEILYISLPTVKGHIRNIFEKMGVASRTQICHMVSSILFQRLELQEA